MPSWSKVINLLGPGGNGTCPTGPSHPELTAICIKSGTVTMNSDSLDKTVTFQTPFVSNAYAISLTPIGGQSTPYILSHTESGFTIMGTLSHQYFWIAIYGSNS